MSLTSRIKSLEEKSASGFQVIMPYELGRHGHELAQGADKELVCAVRWTCAGEVFKVVREDGEEVKQFHSRATREAAEAFPGALPLWIGVAHL
ncbi:MAG: hypothetical protein AAGD04_01635 [Pseudomonadota bacterium]